MRKFTMFLAVTMLFCATAFTAQNQNSNSVTVTVVAVPSAPVISVSPTNYYQNAAATMTITVGSGGVSSACTGTWDTISLPLTFTAASGTVSAKFTAPITAAMTATLGTHAVVISCPLPVLSMTSPVTLPNASIGQSYSADLNALANLQENGQPCKTCRWSLSSGSLPTGLTLQSSGIVTGTTSSAGSFDFGFTVSDAVNAANPPAVNLLWVGDDPMSGDGTSTVLFYTVYRRSRAADPTFSSTLIRS